MTDQITATLISSFGASDEGQGGAVPKTHPQLSLMSTQKQVKMTKIHS